MSTTLKLVSATAALAALLTVPALAGQRVAHHRAVAYGAQMPVRAGTQYRALYRGEDPVVREGNGRVIGTDPDPNIRALLRREIGPNGTGVTNAQ